MNSLVIGGDGLIGSGIKSWLWPDVVATTRRHDGVFHGSIFLDLLQPPEELPHADVAYICAGINGIRENEGNATAWRTNVDGVISVIRLLGEAFIVYISSSAVEWSDTSYARQRALVECGLRFRGHGAIVRPQRVTRDNVNVFAQYIAEIGQTQRVGVYQWP